MLDQFRIKSLPLSLADSSLLEIFVFVMVLRQNYSNIESREMLLSETACFKFCGSFIILMITGDSKFNPFSDIDRMISDAFKIFRYHQ